MTRLHAQWYEETPGESAATWTIINHLPSLNHSVFVTDEPENPCVFETMQAWLDRCAERGRHITRVEIRCVRSSGDAVYLVWNPQDSPLRNAEWKEIKPCNRLILASTD
jgi:hypothetical protein